jgi:ATP-dependent RNA helicase DeaD
VTVSDFPRRSEENRPDAREEAPLESRAHADDVQQLFLNVGRREGVRAPDLEKFLSERGIALGDPDGIRIRDRMTFIRVKKELCNQAIAVLSGQVIGGRTVVAELARGGRA